MSTWQIEHTPAAGGGSATYTLAALNASSLSIQFTNWADDSAALTVRGGTAAFDAPAFAYRDKVVIWRDGARFFHGWVTGLGLAAERSESRTYTITGPSWWLEHLPFMWPTWPAKEELSLGERASFRWIGFALDSAINKGAPIAKDSGNYATFILPTPDIRASSNCLEVLQRVARLHPMSAGWWDYSGEVPVFRAALRSALPVQTVTIGTDSVETFGFTPLPDQQVESVHIAYNYTDDFGAHTVHNTAGTEPYGYGPNKLHIACDVETAALASEAQSAGIAPLLYASLSPLAWSGAVNMHETVASLQVIRPGIALSVAGGRAEWATMATVVQSTQWVVSAATNDTCSITLGAPEHLGPQDYLEFARAGTLAASSAGNNPGPYDPPTPTGDDDPPGNYQDLDSYIQDRMEELGIPIPTVTLEWRTRSAVPALGGFGPLDEVESAPPRRWLRKQLSGTITGELRYAGPTALIPYKGDKTATPAINIGTDVQWSGTICTLGGWEAFNPATLAVTSGGENDHYDPAWETTADYSGASSYDYGVSVDSATVATSPTNLRYGWAKSEMSSYSVAIAGQSRIDLSIEDTEANAWARANPTWSAWAAGAGSAALELRTGLSYHRTECAGRGAGPGGDPGRTYSVHIYTEQRPYGGDGTEWASGATIAMSVTADGGGDVEIPEFDLPAASGTERRYVAHNVFPTQ